MAKRRWIIGLVVVVGAVFALWPRAPRLEWYTSPSLTTNHGVSHARLLVPSGWTTRETWGSKITEVRPGRPSVISVWLSPVLGLTRDGNSKVSVDLNLDSDDERGYVDATATRNSVHVTKGIAEKEIKGAYLISSDGTAAISYINSDSAEFDATYRQICKSFRVIREK
jgi:hypothetical protein